ncbi:MAG: class I SAM-dependent methyltransferase [Acidobacteriota bacterium]|nr:class I SAM-dependent methyltransferase [Acidobacteriota bacterium]
MSRSTLFMPVELQAYMVETSLRELPIQRQLRNDTLAMPRAQIQSSPEQVQLMQLLVCLTRAKRCLEVGVFTGYSALGIALALPPDGLLVACEINERLASIARTYWKQAKVDAKIDLRVGPAVETLDMLLADGAADTFDFAYIDADKTNVDNYYERTLQLLRPNGLMSIDNVFWGGSVALSDEADSDTVAVKALNRKIGRDPRVDVSMVPIGDGVSLVRKRLASDPLGVT